MIGAGGWAVEDLEIWYRQRLCVQAMSVLLCNNFLRPFCQVLVQLQVCVWRYAASCANKSVGINTRYVACCL
jgi:hypothetical protein